MARRPTTTASCCFVADARIAPLPRRSRATSCVAARGALERREELVEGLLDGLVAALLVEDEARDVRDVEPPPTTSIQPLRLALAGTLSERSTFFVPACGPACSTRGA